MPTTYILVDDTEEVPAKGQYVFMMVKGNPKSRIIGYYNHHSIEKYAMWCSVDGFQSWERGKIEWLKKV